MPHPDMIETLPPRAKRKRATTRNNPTPTTTRHAPRPILGKRALRGLHRILDAMPPGAYLDDADLTAGVRYLVDYLAWYESPAIVAKRKAHGAMIKDWAARKAATATPNPKD